MTPIYWGTYAPELETAIKNLNFVGKRVRVITTHEGSGLGTVLQDLKKVCTNIVIDKNALAIRGRKVKDSKPLIQKWL